jgi:hypothetical protein
MSGFEPYGAAIASGCDTNLAAHPPIWYTCNGMIFYGSKDFLTLERLSYKYF